MGQTKEKEAEGSQAMIGILIALISGALMSIQGVFNTQVTESSSVWVSASWAVWAVKERTNLLGVFQVDHKYMLLGGVIGAFITFTVIQSMSSLGPAKSVMLIVIAQLLVAYLIELTGIFGVEKAVFEWRKALGMAVAIVGVILFKWE